MIVRNEFMVEIQALHTTTVARLESGRRSHGADTDIFRRRTNRHSLPQYAHAGAKQMVILQDAKRAVNDARINSEPTYTSVNSGVSK